MPVVDASVCVALFKADESGHAASVSWLEDARIGYEPIVSPTIVLAEVAAALGRGLGREDLARQAVEMLRTKLIRTFPVTEALAADAADIAARQRVRGCDSIYLALARQLQMELITFDREQLERGAGVVVTRTP